MEIENYLILIVLNKKKKINKLFYFKVSLKNSYFMTNSLVVN